jgi:N-acetylglutamate synthase-like GNAT family acetyltransferase
MSDLSSLSRGFLLRPARAADKWRIQRLLRNFDQESTPRSTRSSLLMRYTFTGLLVVFGIHLVMSVGMQLLFYLLGIIGTSLLAQALSIVLSTDWIKFWVIEYDGKLVACAKLCRYDTHSVLYNVLVSPKWRRRGIGSFLVEHLADAANKPLYLACYPDKLSFYRRLGFVQVKRRDLAPLLWYDLGLSTRRDLIPLVMLE